MPQPGNTVTQISGAASPIALRPDLGHTESRSPDEAPQASPAVAIHPRTTTAVHTLMDDLQIHCEVRDLVVCSAGSCKINARSTPLQSRLSRNSLM